jgi:hypothetical protein
MITFDFMFAALSMVSACESESRHSRTLKYQVTLRRKNMDRGPVEGMNQRYALLMSREAGLQARKLVAFHYGDNEVLLTTSRTSYSGAIRANEELRTVQP